MSRLRAIRLATLLLGAAASFGALGAGGGGGGGAGGSSRAASDADFDAGVAAVQHEDWTEVRARMDKVVARNRRNADAYNYLGLAYRHLGRMDDSFRNYEAALKIDPHHLGALEYLGEAYLQVGRLADAQVQLKALNRACWLGCEEQKELREKIEAYQRQTAAR